ncbi:MULTISPECIES: ABC transporter ATP-binding protein [unclassified Aeromicrobium]|uniref:ABC transporter ATP-binding protein n=1 Tax=unclassified Aeromicrobium TaxID=2633570 RepID=UPI0009EBAB9F|nr:MULTISPECIES: ABC transporter ATP-binding protein [unclassified Aeromicrobium]
MTSMELRGVHLDAPDGTTVLDGLDLVVPEGSTTVLCGPAGAGKSAVLRVLVGLEEHTEGDVLLDDIVVNAVGPRARDLALVLQDYVLHPHLDVHDNLAFATRLRRGHDKVELAERIDEVAAFLALDSMLDAKPADLEPAQRQRVAIGRALVRDALGYLFDDPFSAQADRVRTHVRSVTTQWQRDEQRTSLFTTSRADEALTMADRVAVMHRGTVHQTGTPDEVYADPDDLFVAAFLGQPPMNLLPATVGDTHVETPVASVPLDDALRAAIGERATVIVGIRPEHCQEPSTDPAPAAASAGEPLTAGAIAAQAEAGRQVTVAGRVDDAEWRGGTQLVYVGYDLDEEVEVMLEEIEDRLDFDLFQNFFVAELPSTDRRSAGQDVRFVVPRERVLLFDVETGARLRTS